MNALIDQLTAMRLPGLTTVEKQLIDARTVERRVRSIQYQMKITKLPHHKDFATFHCSAPAVTRPRAGSFCSGRFSEEAHNLFSVDGTGTGKTHIVIVLGSIRRQTPDRSAS